MFAVVPVPILYLSARGDRNFTQPVTIKPSVERSRTSERGSFARTERSTRSFLGFAVAFATTASSVHLRYDAADEIAPAVNGLPIAAPTREPTAISLLPTLVPGAAAGHVNLLVCSR